MHVLGFCAAALSYLVSARAQKIPFDMVEPFKEVEPDCQLNQLALMFKPQLHISSGCHPYPAFDEHGLYSGGISAFRWGTSCSGSKKGSQVYGRSFYNADKNIMEVMFVWYFPVTRVISPFYFGHHHNFENVIIYIDVSGKKPKLIGAAASGLIGYRTYYPPRSEYVDGNSFKLKYTWLGVTHHYLKATKDPGEFQDLIMWENITESVREKLHEKTWFGKDCPFCDNAFFDHLERARPY